MKTTKSLNFAQLALVALLFGLVGPRLSVTPPMLSFVLFMSSGALGLVVVVWGLVVKSRKTARGGALAAALGAVPLVAVALAIVLMVGKMGPGINDISTDTADPPMFAAWPEHGEYPAEFVAKAAEAYPDIMPLNMPLQVPFAVNVATDVAEAHGWTIVQPRGDGFEAYELSRLFRFRDDIVVRVRGAPEGSILDIRSASRSGKADFGVNAERIESFLAAVRQRVR